mmetsp:Transcript_7078/g.9248  ORF Transcript_7078/g.9248 Transcript_7078/m.9248 type:complete len:704 (-) Transcript_7078:719-2830(-)
MGTKTRRKSRNGRKNRAPSGLEQYSDDEIDKFNDDRLKVLDEEGKSSSDSEDDLEDEREAVLDLDDEKNQSGDDSDAESSDDDKAYEEYLKEKQVAEIGKSWGKSRSAFFKDGEISSDDDDEDDEDNLDAREEEEKEARRIQKEVAAGLQEEDFELFDDDEGEDSKGKKSKRGKKKVSKKSASEMEVVSLKSGKKKKLGDEAKLELLMSQAPELVGLLDDFDGNIKLLRDQIVPFLQSIKSETQKTDEGISYLEAKFHVMLTYCVNIAYYLLMKAEGKSVKEHPVIEQLVRIRVLMEKLRPLDKKLKPQFDRLIQSIGKQATNKSREEDATSFKPNPEDLMGDDSDSDEDEMGSEVRSEKMSGSNGRKYIVPKLAAVPFLENEKAIAKQTKLEEKRKARERKNRMLSDLREEFSERPSEVAAIGTEDKDSEAREMDERRREYEESNFIRLRESKKEKQERLRRERKAQQGMANSLAELEEFEEMQSIIDSKKSKSFVEEEEQEREQSLKRFMKKMEQSVSASRKKKEKERRSADEIFKINDPMEIKMQNHQEDEELDDGDSDEPTGGYKHKRRMRKLAQERAQVDSEDEDEFYRKVAKSKKKRKKEKKEMYTYPESMQPQTTGFVEDGEKRAATYKILKNKGLHAHKKKEDRNPRLKMRKKYERKLKRRKGQVQTMRTGETENYVGEASGLRSNLVRSRKPGQ